MSELSSPSQRLSQVHADLARGWQDGCPQPLEVYLEQYPDLGADPAAVVSLIYTEMVARERRGQAITAEEYAQRFPALAEPLRRFLEVHEFIRAANGTPPVSSSDGSSRLRTQASSNGNPPVAAPDTRTPPGEGKNTADSATEASRLVVPGYEILEKLGQGGMGVVYKARHQRLNRVVALKMIRRAEHAGEQELVRFLAEAEAVAHLHHSNVVQLFDSGTHNGLPFFTLEFVSGGSLADKLREQPLKPVEAARLVEQVAQGVQHAHERGIIHRDLKPANVLLAEDGTPKVTDFGLARRVETGSGLTASGAVVGTPSYMAPEQARGDTRQVGRPADVYALGAILYECLTGRPPFRAATPLDTMLQIVSEEPVPVRALQPNVPRDLETICHKCLHREPAKRYATAQELADDLRRFQNGEPIHARPVSTIERAVKWVRRRPTAAALIAVAVLVVVGAVVGGFAYEQQLRRTRAEASKESLLAALRTADTPEVGRIVDEVAVIVDLLEPDLRAILEDPAATEREKLHASLALLRGDSGQVRYLSDRLLAAEPQEVVVIRDSLKPHARALSGRLWTVLEDAEGDPDQRLRAACALAAFAPDDARWAKVSGEVTLRLIGENVFVVGQWARALKPVSRHLLPRLAPLLLEEGRSAAERRALAQLYRDYAEGVADGFGPLEKVLSEPSAAAGEARLAQARRQANAAVALAAMGRWEKVTPLLRHSPDPTVRSYLIDQLGSGGVEAQTVIDRLNGEADLSVRRALLLALGEFGQDRLSLYKRQRFVPQLVALYRNDPDPGIHGVSGWLLRHWEQQAKVAEVDQASREREPAEGRRWYVNSQGQTMVLVPPGEFETTDQTGKRQKVKIERAFALAAREVTVAEFRRFHKNHPFLQQYAPTEDCPVIQVSWYDAAEYCNWLSKEEGIAANQWCYEPNDKGAYAEGMQVKPNALSLSGYRLPTEAEWEYACRVGSVTGWSMGEDGDLLGKYAWHLNNSSMRSHPVGILRPNDLGLFDLHGNVWEWCQNKLDNRGIENHQNDIEDKVDNKRNRSLRGGTFNIDAPHTRSAGRSGSVPVSRPYPYGFRSARTFR